MKFSNFLIQILIISQTFSLNRKCPGLKWDMNYNKELKMSFQLGSRTSTILKESIPNLEDKNYKKVYFEAKDGSWIFRNGRPYKININSEEVKKDLGLNVKEIQSYSTFFQSNFLTDCVNIHNLIDRAVFLFFELFVLDFQNLKIRNKNKNILLEDPFNLYRGFKKVSKDTFKSKYNDIVFKEDYFEMIDNELHFETIKTYSKSNINKFIRQLMQIPNVPDIFEIENKQLKNDIMEEVGKYLAFNADSPHLILTFQMPIDLFVAFYKKTIEQGIFDNEKELFINNFLSGFKNKPANCKKMGPFNKELCEVLMSLNVDGIRIPTNVFSLTILIMDLMHSVFYSPDDPKRYQPDVRGIRQRFHISMNTNLKAFYFSFNALDKEVFLKIWKENSFFDEDWVLISYDDYNGNTENNSDITSGGWIDSIIDSKGRYALLYNALTKSVNDKAQNLVTRDCDTCIIIEVDAYETVKMINRSVDKENTESVLRFGSIAKIVKYQAGWFFSLEKSRIIIED